MFSGLSRQSERFSSRPVLEMKAVPAAYDGGGGRAQLHAVPVRIAVVYAAAVPAVDPVLVHHTREGVLYMDFPEIPSWTFSMGSSCQPLNSPMRLTLEAEGAKVRNVVPSSCTWAPRYSCASKFSLYKIRKNP